MLQKQVEWIGANLWTIIIIVSIFIQITPIKINPWSALFKWIGQQVTGNACNKIDGLVEKISHIEEDVKTNEKDRIRWEILDFANSCRNNRRHTREEYQHIIALNDKYCKLLKETHDANGVFEADYKYIKKLYAERLEKNDFL